MALGHGPIASTGIAGQRWNLRIYTQAVAVSSTVLVSRLRSVLFHKSVTSAAIATRQRLIALYQAVISSMVIAFTHLATFLKSLSTSAGHSVSRVNRVGKNISKVCTSTVRRTYNILMYRVVSLSNAASRVNQVGKNLTASFTIGNILLHHRTALRALLSPAGTTIGPIFRRFISFRKAVVVTTTPRLIKFYNKAVMLVTSAANPIRKNKINLNFVADDPSTSEASAVLVRGDTKHFQLVLTGLAHNFNRVFKMQRATVVGNSFLKRAASLYRSVVEACATVVSKKRNLLNSISTTSISVATMARYRTILKSLQAIGTHAVARVNQVGKNARATGINMARHLKTVMMHRIATSTSSARRARVAYKSFIATSASIPAIIRSVVKNFSVTSTGLVAIVNSVLKNAHATSINVARRVNRVGKNALAIEASIASTKKAISLTRSVASTAIATRIVSLIRVMTTASTAIATKVRVVGMKFTKISTAIAARTRTILRNASAIGNSVVASSAKSINMVRIAASTSAAHIVNSAGKYISTASTAIATRTRTVYKNSIASYIALSSKIKSVRMNRSTLNHIGVASLIKLVKMNRAAASPSVANILNSALKNLSTISAVVVLRVRTLYKKFTKASIVFVNIMRALPYNLFVASNSTVTRAIKFAKLNRLAISSSIGLFVPRINRIFIATGSNLVTMKRFFGRNLLAVSSPLARRVRILYRAMLVIVSPLAVRGYNLFVYRSLASTAFSHLPKTLIFAPKLASSITIAFRRPVTVLKNLIVASALVLRLINFAFGLAKPNKSRTITVKPRVRTIKVRK